MQNFKKAIIASTTLFVIFCLFVFGKSISKENKLNNNTVIQTEPGINVVTVVTNYDIIWGMDFLPNADLLFTEKKGRLFRYSKGKVSEITGLPVINNVGQGGLLDIKVHPKYSKNGWIYCTITGFDENKKGCLSLIRFSIINNKITDLTTLFKTTSPNIWLNHYGSRITIDKADMIYISLGEGGAKSYGGANSPNQNAQDLNVDWGKVHRIKDDGKIPADNPILPGKTAPTSIFSYGHRNPQGLVYNPFTKEVLETEHGPRGGDELNSIKKGMNYGWPLVSFGINNDDKPVSNSPFMDGIEPPMHTWTPSIAPSGLAVITSNKYKNWKGNILVGSLSKIHLSRLEMVNHKVIKETMMLKDIGRVRNVKMGTDGYIYVAVEMPGRILKLLPE